MNYNLQNAPDLAIRPTQTPMAVRAGWYDDGELPAQMLADKFEETDMDYAEDQYDDFARGLMIDRRPDQNKFEYEEPRGATNASYGRLQLQYYGHRGSEDVPMPELMLGFVGDADREVRGINVDPDFKEYATQSAARNRFYRFSKDGSDFIVDSHRAEAREIRDRMKTQAETQKRWQIFDRQLDGRTPATTKVYRHQSAACHPVHVQGYGDFITDAALNIKRNSSVVCGKIIRQSRAWRDQTSDQDYSTHVYADARRKNMKASSESKVLTAQQSQDSPLGKTDTSIHFKAAGVLMSQHCDARAQHVQMLRNADCDFGSAKQTVVMKQATLSNDINALFHEAQSEARFATSDETAVYQNTGPVEQMHGARSTTRDGVTPAHHYHNAEILYKAAKQGQDFSAVRENIVTDSNFATSDQGINLKSAKMQMIYGAILDTQEDGVRSHESIKTHNYKIAAQAREQSRNDQHIYDNPWKASDQTQDRKRSDQLLGALDIMNNTEQGMDFKGNYYGERCGGVHGSKYTQRYIDTDARHGVVGDA